MVESGVTPPPGCMWMIHIVTIPLTNNSTPATLTSTSVTAAQSMLPDCLPRTFSSLSIPTPVLSIDEKVEFRGLPLCVHKYSTVSLVSEMASHLSSTVSNASTTRRFGEGTCTKKVGSRNI